MKFFRGLFSALFFFLIGFLACYFNWGPTIVDFIKSIFIKK